jgi:hypothetical protein
VRASSIASPTPKACVEERNTRAGTSFGESKVVAEPPGTRRGFNDLRRGATLEHVGEGLRLRVASVPDVARMSAALGHELGQQRGREAERLAQLEIERSPRHGHRHVNRWAAAPPYRPKQEREPVETTRLLFSPSYSPIGASWDRYCASVVVRSDSHAAARSSRGPSAIAGSTMTRLSAAERDARVLGSFVGVVRRRLTAPER